MKREAFILLLTAAVSFGQASFATGKSRGVPSAPITIELFSDFQCAACKGFYEQTIRPMINDYVNPGKVYLVHRDFPLPMHPYAREAAAWASAAQSLGKYEQVCEALFARQDEWSKTGNIEAALSAVLGPADTKKVKALTKLPGVVAEIEKDVKLGMDAKIQQTPTIVIRRNQERFPVSGAVSYSILRRFLDQQLGR